MSSSKRCGRRRPENDKLPACSCCGNFPLDCNCSWADTDALFEFWPVDMGVLAGVLIDLSQPSAELPSNPANGLIPRQRREEGWGH